VKENNSRIISLEKTVNDLKESYRSNINIIKNKVQKKWDFPIKTLKQLDDFEDKLNNEKFKTNIVSYFNYNNSKVINTLNNF